MARGGSDVAVSGSMIFYNRVAELNNTMESRRATQNPIAVPPRRTPSSGLRRRPLRWASSGTGALLFSAVAHAMAAVTAGVVLRSIPPSSALEAEAVDVDVAVAALLSSPADAPPPATAASHRAAQQPVARRLAPARRTRATAPHLAREPHPSTAAASAAVAVAPAPGIEAPARFALSAGTVATQAGGAALTAASGSPASAASGDTDALGERAVNVPARLLSSSPLVYPARARQAEIEIDLPLEIVVDADGRVAATRALSHAGYGLDEAAERAMRAYRFSPALRAGRPVRVRMRWTVQFRLR
jgi:TonB family protein